MSYLNDEDLTITASVTLTGTPTTGKYLLHLKSEEDARDLVCLCEFFNGTRTVSTSFYLDNTTFMHGMVVEVLSADTLVQLASARFDNPNIHATAVKGAAKVFELQPCKQNDHKGDYSSVEVSLTVTDRKPFRGNLTMDEVNRDLVEGAKHGLLGTVDNRLWMGADRNHARAVDGYTALCAAAEGGHLDVMEKLLDSGADSDAFALNGRTALSIAAAARRPAAVALLLQRGAMRAIEDEAGLTAVQIGSAFPEVAAVFEEYRPKRRSAKSAGSSAAKASASTGAAQAESARPKGAASSDTSKHSFSAAAPVARGSRAPMVTDFPEKGNRRWSSSSAASSASTASVGSQSSAGSASSSTSTETRTTRLRTAKNLETKKKLDDKEEKEKKATKHLLNKKWPAPAAPAPAAPAAAAAPSGSSKRAKVTSAPAPTASIPAFPAASAVASSSSASSAAPAASSSGIGGSAAAASSAKPRAGSSSGVLGKRVTRKG